MSEVQQVAGATLYRSSSVVAAELLIQGAV